MSAVMCRSTLPSEVMCGVTSSERRASTNSVFTPAADTWLNGIDVPWLIFAVCSLHLFVSQLWASAAAFDRDLRLGTLRTRGGLEVDFVVTLGGAPG